MGLFTDPLNLAMDKDYVYLVDWGFDTVFRINKYTGQSYEAVGPNVLDRPYGIFISGNSQLLYSIIHSTYNQSSNWATSCKTTKWAGVGYHPHNIQTEQPLPNSYFGNYLT